MKTYPYMNGDRLIMLVEKQECDGMELLAHELATLRAEDMATINDLRKQLQEAKQERADFGALVDKLERELDAAKAESEAMKKAIKTAADSLDGLDLHLPRNHGMFLLLALKKLQPFLTQES